MRIYDTFAVKDEKGNVWNLINCDYMLDEIITDFMFSVYDNEEADRIVKVDLPYDGVSIELGDA